MNAPLASRSESTDAPPQEEVVLEMAELDTVDMRFNCGRDYHIALHGIYTLVSDIEGEPIMYLSLKDSEVIPRLVEAVLSPEQASSFEFQWLDYGLATERTLDQLSKVLAGLCLEKNPSNNSLKTGTSYDQLTAISLVKELRSLTISTADSDTSAESS